MSESDAPTETAICDTETTTLSRYTHDLLIDFVNEGDLRDEFELIDGHIYEMQQIFARVYGGLLDALCDKNARKRYNLTKSDEIFFKQFEVAMEKLGEIGDLIGASADAYDQLYTGLLEIFSDADYKLKQTGDENAGFE